MSLHQCLKGWLGITSFLLILVGIMGIVFSVFEFGTAASIVNDLEAFELSLSVGALLFALLLCVIGSMGLYGTCRGNKCVLSVFNLASMVMLVLGLVIGGVGFFGPPAIFKECNSNDNNWARPVRQIYEDSRTLLCSTDCGCLIKNISIYDQYVQAIMEQPSFNKSATNTSFASKYKECPRKQFNKTHESLELLEKHLNCTGWCTRAGYFIFNDINEMPGEGACYDEMESFVKSNGVWVGVGGLGCALIFVVNVAAGCCVCLRDKKEDRRKDEDYMKLV